MALVIQVPPPPQQQSVCNQALPGSSPAKALWDSGKEGGGGGERNALNLGSKSMWESLKLTEEKKNLWPYEHKIELFGHQTRW